MRFATIRTRGGRTSAARLDGEQAVPLPYRDVGTMLADPGWIAVAAAQPAGDAVEAPRFATLVPHPNKIICLGLNYATHIAEMGRPTPLHPTLFAKFDGSLLGAHDDIRAPAVSDELDWEAELGVVIGRPGRSIAEHDALDHVAGYTVVNDITVRDWQHRTREFLSGKTFEATTPVGPWLVTPDEVPPGAAGLDISCRVDGRIMQESTTADLLFDVKSVISYVSTIITLLPGDLIATGTPGGVGAGLEPKVFLAPGQEVVTTIEGVGELRNRVVKDPPRQPYMRE